MKLLISRRKKDANKLSESVLNLHVEEISSFRKGNLKTMWYKFLIFYIIYFLIMAFDFYYVIIFCAVYQGSSLNWLADGFIGIIIFYIFKVFFFIVTMFMRVILRSYPNKLTRFLNWIINKAA